MGMREATFLIPKELWKEFAKACIDKEITKSEMIRILIKKFLDKK